ncbi:MAG TPA: SCP2 sterol-binding domain-containing protein [Gallionellaceae bacterium]
MLQLSASALNHLLAQNVWALQRLARFAGKTARFNVAPFSFAWTIQSDGLLANAAPGASADVTCNVAPSLLPRLALKDEAAFTQIETTGDAALLTEIFYLSRHLRWDAAEDLSHITGDVAAERLVQLARAKQQQVRDTTLNLSQALAEYWTEESPLLAKPTQVSDFISQVDQLRDDVARLEQRLNRLTKK